jgi:hypothetical protein
LVGYVMNMVVTNRTLRDTVYKARWDEYYRTWRGKWSPLSQTRRSERSRIVSPATQSAIDIKMSEILEALLGREAWFDIPAGLDDQQKEQATIARDRLMEDLEKDGIIPFLAELVLNGCLYGQLNAKIVVEVRQEAQPLVVEENGRPVVKRAYTDRVAVFPVAVEPGQLVYDTSGPTKSDQMLGLAHEFPMGLHDVKARMEKGTYRKVAAIGPSMSIKRSTFDRMEEQLTLQSDSAFITEYHGKVPTRMLTAWNAQGDELALEIAGRIPAHEFTEAIVTIANEGILLRAVANPAVMDDRAIVSEQFDTVPNSFLGRGDAEKAFNGQKGLDTELRARADALAWVNNPMMAGDQTRMMPKQDLNVWPGKFFATNGDPSEVLREFRFGDVNPSTFQQAGEYEKMIQQAIGAFDPAAMREGVRDESAMASGIAASGLIKRSKRTMFHMEAFLSTLLRRILWRKMQFDPQRYPQDWDFRVKGTIGILAREVEMMHLTAMLQYVPEGSPVQLMIVKTLFENSASPYKAELAQAVEQMMQPDPKQQQMQQLQQQLTVADLEAGVNLKRAMTAKAMADAGVSGADATLKQIQAQIAADDQRLEHIRTAISSWEAQIQQGQVDAKNRALDLQERQHKLAYVTAAQSAVHTNRELDIKEHKARTDRFSAIKQHQSNMFAAQQAAAASAQ